MTKETNIKKIIDRRLKDEKLDLRALDEAYSLVDILKEVIKDNRITAIDLRDNNLNTIETKDICLLLSKHDNYIDVYIDRPTDRLYNNYRKAVLWLQSCNMQDTF